MPRSHDHGDLPAALLQAAVDVISEAGAAAMSLRDVARRAAVSHTAAAYHFGDKAGLLTAVAVDGYRLLGETLAASQREQRSFLEMGVSYVRFAVTHPAHFDVMFQPALYHADTAAIVQAKATTAAMLYGTQQRGRRQLVDGAAAWSIVHGLATLWVNGNLPPELGEDPEAIAREVLARLNTSRR